jgi:ADP-heptose:LPS heptosyltransferase
MKLSSMRRIDYWVGVPACFLVSLWVKLCDALFPGRRLREGRILFIELSEMGSTILAAPAIVRAIQRYPEKPCFVIFEKNVQSLKLLGLFADENIFTIRDTSLVAMATDVLRFARFCRRRGVSATVDLELYARVSSLLAMFSGARTRVGFDNYLGEGLWRGNHLTHRVSYSVYYHMSQNFMALVEALERPAEGQRVPIPLPKQYIPLPEQVARAPRNDESAGHVRRELERLVALPPDARLVILNHDAGQLLPIRSWPLARWAALARRLLEHDPRCVVLLMGIPSSAESAGAIAAEVGHPRLVNFIGKTRHLTDVINLFHQAELLITNDSGPAHFATLTDIAAITLFGPETPRLYGPRGPRCVNLYKELACSPCLTAANHRHSPCTDNVCLQEISTGEVFDQAVRLLAERARVPAAR